MMKRDEKKCPACAETIKKEALVCKHCGAKFSAEEVAAGKAKDKNVNGVVGCLGVLIFLVMVATCVGKPSDPQSAAVEAKAEADKSAENKRKGFHCLSAWDGSHRGVADAVKERLRDPDSFEHIETRIAPVDKDGAHALLMKYRARNGFGGMNVSEALATVKNSDCSATIISIGG
ncbi:zinc ribbon domain-containing protein [Sphingobium phenoxybenzoativorans]|uniref:zinc ribbon domain-containing protein n=1 Tax=Sphingobium phenoxybenzoativorans TaxID=1592790 RepID=UPI0008720FCE|nr:hypothetical protein [Sphingobium phenoxybenzoativorans]